MARLSHGLDKQTFVSQLTSGSGSISNGVFGGNGQGAMIRTPFSWAFQGSAAIPSTARKHISPWKRHEG